MGKKLILATRNAGKVREMQALLAGLDLEVLSLNELPDLPEIEEDGATFQENALKKAKGIAEASGMLALADDSGLEVDALGGAPGVYSARYAGERASDEANNRKLLEALRDVPLAERRARFKCVIVVYHPSGRWIDAEGDCEGEIAAEPQGTHGFGYDPVFWLPDQGCTMAQLSAEGKNRISHRARALQALQTKLPAFLQSI